jgi:hypothetical protein
MTAVNGAPAPGADLEGMAALPGLETVTGQIADLIAVLRAEQARRRAGIEISRPAWKNLVFTGGPGTGKSRAARALARLYKDLGLLSYGHLIEIAVADLPGATPGETATHVAEVIKPTGDLLLITGAHTWHDLPGHGQHLLSCLYQLMTPAHRDHEHHPDELAIIMSGRKDPLHALLAASPALAARFPAVIDFPGYTPAQLAAIITELASEAGLRLTADAKRKAAVVLADAEKRRATGHARRAVRLQAEVLQQRPAQRVRAAREMVAAGPQHIEDDQRDGHRGQQPGTRPTGAHPPLQQGEVRPRTGQGDDLLVRGQPPAPGHRGERAEFGIGGSDVAPGTGPGPDPPVRHGDTGAQAVPLHLGHELGGVRRQRGRRHGEDRRDETRAVLGCLPRHRVPPRLQAEGMPGVTPRRSRGF